MLRIKAAEEVLSFYSLQEPMVEFIRHNENMTFKVTDKSDGKLYLLRIHSPSTAGLLGIQHAPQGLESEMYILQELSKDGTLHVQKPVTNRNGGLVTEYLTSGKDVCYATLLEWIVGSTLTLQEDNIEQIAYQLGEKLAALHQFSRHTELTGLQRPVYDAERIDAAVEELKYGVVSELYSQEQYEIITQVLGIIKEQFRVLETLPDQWGIVHADVQLGNVIITENGPCLIDFGFSGYGYYLFDLGSAGTVLPGELRQLFLQGYTSAAAFSWDQIRYIEGQIFMDTFISYLFFIRDSARNDWIKQSAAKLCSTLCKDFIAGKEVFYSF
ncbi:phosphotransferase enzyme family protein [Paenibacillus sp. sgz5001063]|uniref:phosphotransferase enzyme family protein n=1 Tax=Paenibacillus sp. sgz5001063 TaxID=3242474 RepID=UPI0036D3A638